MMQAYSYVLFLLTGLVLLALFSAVYTKVTPFQEMDLIRQGNTAAAASLAGAWIGFCLTLASGIWHHSSYLPFLAWAGGAMAVQIVTYIVIARTLPKMQQAIEANNVAMGLLMGSMSLAVGIINAACLS
jgi:putative membrane protein